VTASDSLPAAKFSSSYATLPDDLFAFVAPTPVASPRLLRLNAELVDDLDLGALQLDSPEGVAILAGNRALRDAAPIAMAYAGHQFGNWVPSLGDGRAIQIGEAVDRAGVRRGIQLKGAGPTPYSRSGDGRAAIGPVMREYVLSEAMHALGVPTTRALAMVATGEPVYRQTEEPGAILTRVASGYVRVGTFEYFAARGMTEAIRSLADYVIEHRYPVAAAASKPHLALLESVIECQASLIAKWMLVGFIHGVMNTDNMSIMGETIDYGPCAFLDEYDSAKVFSSIDRGGRYAYRQQPGIGLWNLTRFAEALLPLLADEQDAAVECAEEALGKYSGLFDAFYAEGMRQKIGLAESSDASREIGAELLDVMESGRADFTLTFRGLSSLRLDDASGEAEVRALFDEPGAFDVWLGRWREQLRAEGSDDQTRSRQMRAINPLFIPRNHRVQQAIDAFVGTGDLAPFETLLAVTSRPFEDSPEHTSYTLAPEPGEIVRSTFCGT
jgi:uncharacterized protein YdiU (UPF0061 family)